MRFLSILVLLLLSNSCFGRIGWGFNNYTVASGFDFKNDSRIVEIYFDTYKRSCVKRKNYRAIGIKHILNNKQKALSLRVAYDPLGWVFLFSRNIKFYPYLNGELMYVFRKEKYHFKPSFGVLGNFFERAPFQLKTTIHVGYWASKDSPFNHNLSIDMMLGLSLNFCRLRSLMREKSDPTK
ncbi:MAG: hypothetical protein MRY83_06685 [Flavobacteriales bacterium]|nr:hypothetical protein [Flavobacteriales bacterium]